MKIGLVCSHGGHLTEMLELAVAFEEYDVFWVTYSSERATVLARQAHVYQVKNIGTSSWRLLGTLWPAFGILWRERPTLLVSTGSEIALPFFYLSYCMGIDTVYVESVCRVSTPSQTGRLVYGVATQFFVQWPTLAQVYGRKARYVGGLL